MAEEQKSTVIQRLTCYRCIGRRHHRTMTSDKLKLRIFQVNDVYELDLFPNLKTLIDSNKGEADHVLVVMAGDFLGPSLLSSLDKGRGMVDIMMMCGFTHVSIGNHETDIPTDAIIERVLQSNFVWLNTNMRELDEKLDIDTSPHDIITVTNGKCSKNIVLLGLLTEDPSLYRPDSFAGATIEPVIQCTEKYLNDKIPKKCDLIIPLTHQRMSDDRVFADKFTGETFPIILGGHDHDPFDEIRSGSRINKCGYDARSTGIIDVVWDIADNKIADKPTIHVQLVDTKSYAPDPDVQKRVQAHLRIIEELDKAKLFQFKNWMTTADKYSMFTTANNRVGPSNGTTTLTSLLRMGMRAQCSIINAGTVRGNKVYNPNEHEWFTWSDLKTEIPFPTEMVVVPIPGQVLSDTIAYGREHNVGTGGYIHHCDAIGWDFDKNRIETIQGQPMDPDQRYLTALPAKAFGGMDNLVPLLEWAKCQSSLACDEEAGRPAKMLIVEMFAALLWLEMGSFEQIDTDGDGILTRDEVKERAAVVFGEEVADLVVESIMNVADLHHTGTISPLDMMVVRFVATDMIGHVCTHQELGVMKTVVSEVMGYRPSHCEVKRVVTELRNVLDISGDGKIDRVEAMKAIGEVRKRSLLA